MFLVYLFFFFFFFSGSALNKWRTSLWLYIFVEDTTKNTNYLFFHICLYIFFPLYYVLLFPSLEAFVLAFVVQHFSSFKGGYMHPSDLHAQEVWEKLLNLFTSHRKLNDFQASFSRIFFFFVFVIIIYTEAMRCEMFLLYVQICEGEEERKKRKKMYKLIKKRDVMLILVIHFGAFVLNHK